MRIRKIKAIWCLAVLLAAQGVTAQVAPPSPDELVAKAIAAQTAQVGRDRKYTYLEDRFESPVDRHGKVGPPSMKTFEHITLEGSEYWKLILTDGKPLDAKGQKKIDADLEKTRTERRKSGPPNTRRTVSLGTMELLTRLFDNKVTGEETISGRRTWRMESEPKADARPADKQEEEAIAARQVDWFDQEDGMHVKERHEFIRAVNMFQPGTIVDVQMVRVGDDWLLGDFEIQADMKLMPGIHGRAFTRQHYYNYKRFTVDSTLTSQ